MAKVVLLAGGVGGARMAEGLARALPQGALTVIANIGDDEQFYGLHVSPDIDTLIYTLSDRIDRKQGWGVGDDATKALDVLGELGAPVWMKLGDADFGLHIWRSWQLAQGRTLTDITREAAQRMGATAEILPASDDPVRTRLLTDDGWMDFQPWFVGARCEPEVHEIRYESVEKARASEAAMDALHAADGVVIAPSNPVLSIDPILAIGGFREVLASLDVPRVAVSPLIGGKAVKGPLGRLIEDLGLPEGASGIAGRYSGLIDGFAVDRDDRDDAEAIASNGLKVLATDILMRDPNDAERLGGELIAFIGGLAGRNGGAGADGGAGPRFGRLAS